MKNLKIYGALKRFSKFKQITFSMPGHKRDKRFSPIFKTRQFDVTELTALEIEKACAMAEADVSAIYGARLTRFLSGGSTLGVLSMLNSVRHLGNKIIINRSAHKSVYNACKILNIEPITISGVVRSGVLYAPTFSAVQKAIDENENVIGVLLTYPDYYGKTFDLKKISAFLKEKDKKFLIDGAHGAHLKFFGGVNPLDYADLCVFGAHKTLPTLTGGAFVLAKGVDLAEKLNESVNLFASTSPSYPILSSIEYGVKKFNGLSDRVKEKYTDLLSQLKVKIAKIGYTFIHKTDPLKNPQPNDFPYIIATAVIAQSMSVLIILLPILFDIYLFARLSVATFTPLIFFDCFNEFIVSKIGPVCFCKVKFGIG